MFGRLLPQKGFYYYLAAAKRLKEDLGDDVVFWILGAADHERTESIQLLHEIEHAHAAGTVRYLQSCDDVRPYLQECDVVVLPSTYNEGVPRSLLEALACGKAIITTDWKGCRDTVIPNVNGHLVAPHDTESLISAIRRLALAKDEQIQALGEASRKVAQERFDERLVLNAYLEALTLDGAQYDARIGIDHDSLQPSQAAG